MCTDAGPTQLSDWLLLGKVEMSGIQTKSNKSENGDATILAIALQVHPFLFNQKKFYKQSFLLSELLFLGT